MGRRLVAFAFAVAAYLNGAPPISVAAAAPSSPYVCTGYLPDRGDWQLVGAQLMGPQEDVCPEGYAFIAVDFPVGTPRPARKIGVSGRCCRLPDGVLTDEHMYALERCPADSVATGTRAARAVTTCPDGWANCVSEWESIDQFLRCTKLNTARFHTAKPTVGYTIGFNHPLALEGMSAERFTTRGRIPVGLRYGATRSGRYSFDQGGLIGVPWGSIVTGKLSKRGIEFSTIEYIDDAGRRIPLPTYPECSHVSDPLDPYATCDGTPPTNSPSTPTVSRSTGSLVQLTHAFRKHQLRVLQLAEATVATMLRERRGEIDPADAVARGYPDHWQLSTARGVKDAVIANVLRLLADVEFQACTIRDRALTVTNCEDVTSRSFVESSSRLRGILGRLGDDDGEALIDAALSLFIETLREQQAAFTREHGLRIDAAQVIPVEPAELTELKAYGIVPSDQSVETVDKRSAAIVRSLRAPSPRPVHAAR